MSKEHMDGLAKDLENKILNAKTYDEAQSVPYLSIDMNGGERIYQNVFVVSREKMTKDIEGEMKEVRWGLKVLSKELKDGTIDFCFYYGDVDGNDDWHNKHGGGQVKGGTKEKFKEFLKVLKVFAEVKDMFFNIQDYSMFVMPETQFKYGMKTNQMEGRKYQLSDKAKKHLDKLQEEKDGKSKGKTT